MAETIRIKLTSNAAEVAARLGAFPPAMLQAIAKALDLQNELTMGYAHVNKLRGPRPEFLGRRSDRLALSLRQAVATIEGQTVSSSIGTNVVYAGIHEFGFQGDVQVAAHSRRIIRTLGGGTVSLTAKGKIRKSPARRKHTGDAQVRAHTRRMNMPQRSFLRSSIEERTGDYRTAISNTIVGTWKDTP